MPMHPEELKERKVRWWPVGFIGLSVFCALLWIGRVQEVDRQERFLQWAGVLLGAYILVLIWGFFFSRIPPRVRFPLFGMALLVPLVLVGSLRIRGVTGDLVPLVEWRWSGGDHAEQVAGGERLEVGQVGENQGGSPIAPADADEEAGWSFPQFLGPERNGKLAGPKLAADWSQAGPEELWRRPVGEAWSGFAIVGKRAVTQEQEENREVVSCYHLQTGELLWRYGYEARYATTIAGTGPRATPTVEGETIFAYGATGILSCLRLADGGLVWRRDTLADNGGELADWGMPCSPLVVEDMVVVTPGSGGSHPVWAYDLATGEARWRGGEGQASYSSPLLAELRGVRQIVSFNARHVAAYQPADGEMLWKFPWRAGHPHVAVPLVVDGSGLIVSSGYGTGAARLTVRAPSRDRREWEVDQDWKTIRLKAKFSNPILYEGNVYGMDDGIFTCVGAKTGDSLWKDGRYGHGQMLLVEDLFLIMAERGILYLVQPDPERLVELGSFEVLTSKTWNPPALAGAYLVVRNDQEAACFRMPLRGGASVEQEEDLAL